MPMEQAGRSRPALNCNDGSESTGPPPDRLASEALRNPAAIPKLSAAARDRTRIGTYARICRQQTPNKHCMATRAVTRATFTSEGAYSLWGGPFVRCWTLVMNVKCMYSSWFHSVGLRQIGFFCASATVDVYFGGNL